MTNQSPAPAPVAGAVEDGEREDFEAWMLTQGYGSKPRICSEGSPCAGEYANQYWHKCWDAWQARGDRARTRLALLNALAMNRGFDSVTKALTSLPLAKKGTKAAEQPLRNLQTWLVCSTIGTALRPSAETVGAWIEALETALAALHPQPAPAVAVEASEPIRKLLAEVLLLFHDFTDSIRCIDRVVDLEERIGDALTARSAPAVAEKVPLTLEKVERQIGQALRQHGLTLMKTAAGYEVVRLGELVADSKPQPRFYTGEQES